MKKLLYVCLIFGCVALALCGCQNDSGNKNEEFVFKCKDVVITPNDEAEGIIEKLGKYISYDESNSCAFEGLDKVYKYSGFEIQTYPVKNKDYIYSITFLNDMVSTVEGVSIGASREKVIEIYGDKYESIGDNISYTLGKTSLQFIFRDGKVTSIKYFAIVQ